SKIILLHFYSLVTSLLFDNMFPEFTLFSSLFYRFLIRNWGFIMVSSQCLTLGSSLPYQQKLSITFVLKKFLDSSIKCWNDTLIKRHVMEHRCHTSSPSLSSE
ncbi:MAG: hypothetical protein ACR5LA_07320, partial [Wolbachia sp.]